ncbi:MAG TPA: matrixin family metalloprotease [Polyangia bacterium]|jgi:hypothetical protein
MRHPLALLLVLAAAAPAAAYERAQAASGRPVAWVEREIAWSLAEPGSADVPYAAAVAAAGRAFAAWAEAGCTDLRFTYAAGGPRATSIDGAADGKNVIHWREHDWPGAPDEIALTTVVYDEATGRITDVDIDLNGEYLYFTASDDPARTEYDIESALTHEIGHLLGFADSSDPEAVMGHPLRRGDLVRRLGADDLAALCAVYPARVPKEPGDERIVYAAGCRAAGGAGAGGLLAAAALTLGVLGRPRRHRP